MKRYILLLSLILPLFLFSQEKIDPFHYAEVKSDTFQNFAVASAHPLASRVGMLIMKKGGNAFDAGVATQLALAVVYPGAGNLGGGGFLLGRTPENKWVAIDFRESAPAGATEKMYLDKQGNVKPGASVLGHLAVGVPGTVAGLFSTLRYCRLPFKELIQPAIDLAQHGFVISEREAESLNEARNDLLALNKDGRPFVKPELWKQGDTLIQKDLASTLARLQSEGRSDFYTGKTASLILAEMKRGKGLITAADLKGYLARDREPIHFQYRGYDIVSFPPPSSGGILLAQMLKMVQPFPLDQFGFQSPEAVQLMTEAERRAYADRAVYMGDPSYYPVPVSTLISENYLKKRMMDYQPGKAGSSERTTSGQIPESRQTTHISIVDSMGNMVSITTTLNGTFGSRTIVQGAGFILNNEMDDFSAKPGVPNMYGAVGGQANAIAPGKRMLSSMTPTLVLRNGKPFLVLGTPGGTTIPTSVFQTIVNMVDFKMSVQDAVNKPKFHHQWLPDDIEVEPSFDKKTKALLVNMGYKVVETGNIGRMELIRIGSDGIIACGDNRGNDSVAGE